MPTLCTHVIRYQNIHRSGGSAKTGNEWKKLSHIFGETYRSVDFDSANM